MSGIATRLYRGEAGLNIVGKRLVWFSVAGIAALIAILGVSILKFDLGIEFEGGNKFQLPATVGTLAEAESAVEKVLGEVDTEEPAEVASAQEVRGVSGTTYLIRTSVLPAQDQAEVKTALAEELNISEAQISDSRVSAAWGDQVTERAVLGLLIFVAVVMAYLIVRFEWRMAVAAIASLALDLVLTAGVYALVGFEVTPSTVIGFLTILGFALYDVVVVFDKIQENTRGITGGSSQTYAEAANLAVNQTLMRSINTGLVALLPVGGLLFIGAGLLGAGTLKDLGLVLFVGMGVAVYSSIFFATPVLVTLKEREPRYQAHTARVLARRAALAKGGAPAKAAPARSKAKSAAGQPAEPAAPAEEAKRAALAGTAPKVGSRPGGKRPSGSRNRPGGSKRR